jgi:hypothetical protein
MGQHIATERADHFASDAARFDDASGLETVKVERNEWLRQIDVAGELHDRCGALSEALHQPQTCRVGECLVVSGDGPKLFRWRGNRRDGRSEMGR